MSKVSEILSPLHRFDDAFSFCILLDFKSGVVSAGLPSKPLEPLENTELNQMYAALMLSPEYVFTICESTLPNTLSLCVYHNNEKVNLYKSISLVGCEQHEYCQKALEQKTNYADVDIEFGDYHYAVITLDVCSPLHMFKAEKDVSIPVREIGDDLYLAMPEDMAPIILGVGAEQASRQCPRFLIPGDHSGHVSKSHVSMEDVEFLRERWMSYAKDSIALCTKERDLRDAYAQHFHDIPN